jgi:transcriptional regulator with XRE-family HTH domain
MALQEWVKIKNVTQVEAAKILGVTQPRMSDLARGRIHSFSLDVLMDMAMIAGLSPHIAFKRPKARRKSGRRPRRRRRDVGEGATRATLNAKRSEAIARGEISRGTAARSSPPARRPMRICADRGVEVWLNSALQLMHNRRWTNPPTSYNIVITLQRTRCCA